MRIEKGEIESLYTKYKETHSIETYNEMWFKTEQLLSHNLKALCTKLNVSMDSEELYNLTIDGLIKIIEQVKEHKEIRSFSGLCYWTASNLLRTRRINYEKDNKHQSYEEWVRGQSL